MNFGMVQIAHKTIDGGLANMKIGLTIMLSNATLFYFGCPLYNKSNQFTIIY